MKFFIYILLITCVLVLLNFYFFKNKIENFTDISLHGDIYNDKITKKEHTKEYHDELLDKIGNNVKKKEALEKELSKLKTIGAPVKDLEKEVDQKNIFPNINESKFIRNSGLSNKKDNLSTNVNKLNQNLSDKWSLYNNDLTSTQLGSSLNNVIDHYNKNETDQPTIEKIIKPSEITQTNIERSQANIQDAKSKCESKKNSYSLIKEDENDTYKREYHTYTFKKNQKANSLLDTYTIDRNSTKFKNVDDESSSYYCRRDQDLNETDNKTCEDMPSTSYYYLEKTTPHTYKQDDFGYKSSSENPENCVIDMPNKDNYAKFSKNEEELKELARSNCEVGKNELNKDTHLYGSYTKDKYDCYELNIPDGSEIGSNDVSLKKRNDHSFSRDWSETGGGICHLDETCRKREDVEREVDCVKDNYVCKKAILEADNSFKLKMVDDLPKYPQMYIRGTWDRDNAEMKLGTCEVSNSNCTPENEVQKELDCVNKDDNYYCFDENLESINKTTKYTWNHNTNQCQTNLQCKSKKKDV